MLSIRNISKTFGVGSINERKALSQISLEISEGEFITIIGSNGAGKSTLMNCLAGVDLADEGTILLQGRDITRLPEFKRSRYIGRVFQDPMKGTAYDMTIEQNLAIAWTKDKFRGLQPGLTKREREIFRQQLAVLDMGLENRMKTKVKLLSGGQRQALTLFMATMANPLLLLLDEHTAALDPGTAGKVLELTDSFASSSRLCTLMITHNMSHALEHGSRTILMDNGRILMDISGTRRQEMTVEGLIENFGIKSDRMLLE